MSAFCSVEVPFVSVGNRRGLTALQLVEDPYLMQFFERFRSSFELVLNMDIYLFIEPDTENAGIG
jgi:hypothetical protein